jgi:hypothetical protein
MGDLEASHAAEMIARWGNSAVLRRSGTDRPCVAAELEFNPTQRNLELAGVRRFLLAAPLDPPPNHELDLLVAFGEILRLVAPVKGPRPDGVVVYYDLLVEYQSAA